MIPRWVHVNGRYVPYRNAQVHIEDRGFQFADSVYEVCAVRAGRIWDFDAHLDRLERSLAALEIAAPRRRALEAICAETVRRNGVKDGLVYIQVTRGVAERNHAFPDPPVKATLVVLARPVSLTWIDRKGEEGIAVVTAPDIRWGRCDIKSTGLLANVLAKQAAKAAGAGEVWFLDRDGFVTEGGSTNAWIVTQDRRVVTRQLGPEILAGVTRGAMRNLLSSLGLSLEERPLRLAEALDAAEAFCTSSVAILNPVVAIDGHPIGSGKPGPVATALRRSYLIHAENGAN